MATTVEICNRALQKLGAQRIVSLSENSKNAMACSALFQFRADAMLRKHAWNFATERVALAADAVAPAFGRANAFTLPGDCLRPLPPDPEDNDPWRDWIVENGRIMTNDSGPLYLKYIKRPAAYTDPLFNEALAADIAHELCELITQSNTKKAALKEDLRDAINEARRANAFENVAPTPPVDEWIAVRA